MFAAAVISLVAASCALFGDDESGVEESAGALTASVRGSVAVSGAAPGVFRKSSARTALPSLNGVSYSVVASGGGSPYVAEVDGENLSFSFGDLAVVEGGTEYTITATGTVSGIEVVSGRCTVTLRPGDAFFCEVPVKPDMKSGTGSVSLEIDVSETEIKSCAIELDGGSVSSCQVDSGGKILFEKTLDSGCYDAVFSFYSTADSSSADGVLLYEFRESVHVCKSLVTDSWFGSSAYIADGKCVITKALVEKFALSRIYVSSRKEDSKETGTRAEPYKSVARAMNALLDKDTDYTILVDGELTGAQEIPASVTTANASSITIQGRTGSGTDKINGNNEGTALTIRTAVPVTIKNLKITGGKNASGNGGGIYMASGSNVTLGAGALVGDLTQTTASATSCGNYASYGGGIYNEGSLTLGSGSIVRHNYANPFGGGIWNEGGSVTIKEGAEISYNCAGISDARGGGIRSGGSGSSLTMEGGTISHNSVSHWGGGVMIQGSVFTMTGGTISFNKSTGSSSIGAGGGGIWIDDGTFKMSGDSILSGNEANNKGGGIHVEHAEATVEILGGTISGNNASVSGGAISNNLGKITISGGTIENNSAANGGAVNSSTTFNIKGNPSIPYGVLNESGTLVKDTGKNDVYLPSGKTIKITDELTYESYVIIITPEKYTDGTTVLEAESGVTLADEVGKFEVVPNGSTKYYIAFDGKMYKYKPATQFTTVPAAGDTAGLATMDDFEKIAEWVDDGNELTGVTLILLNDVTLDSSFTPVGEYNTNKLFTGGIFEGNNKTITYDNVSFTQKYSGIFSGAKNATIQNLNLEGTLNINTEYAGGALIGHAEACIVKNCSSSVTITGGSSSTYYLGGIVGTAQGTSVTGKTYSKERDCYILNCVNTGSIIAETVNYIGGIVGNANACVIRNCINKGNITGVKSCGGIVGSTSSSGPGGYGCLIENCGNNGNITANGNNSDYTSGAGGIAGGPNAWNEDWMPKINNCYSSGTITAKDNKAGGIFGLKKDLCTLSKCYYYNPANACPDGNPSGSSKYTSISSILNDMNSLNSSDSANYRKWKVSGSVLEFEE